METFEFRGYTAKLVKESRRNRAPVWMVVNMLRPEAGRLGDSQMLDGSIGATEFVSRVVAEGHVKGLARDDMRRNGVATWAS